MFVTNLTEAIEFVSKEYDLSPEYIIDNEIVLETKDRKGFIVSDFATEIEYSYFPEKAKEAFIELSLALEPEILTQDGERTQKEIEEALKFIDITWRHLEKTFKVSVSRELAEQWSYSR